MKLPIEKYALSSQMPEDVPEDMVPRAWLPLMKKLASVGLEVENRIEEYGDLVERIGRLDVPNEVRAKAKDNLKSLRSRERSWRGIRDDPYTYNMAFSRGVDKGWTPFGYDD